MLNPEKGWHSVGSNIDYQKSFVSREILTNPPTYKNYYTLSFTLNLPNPNDRYYLALNYPYPYSRMTAFLDKLTLHPNQMYPVPYSALFNNRFFAIPSPTTPYQHLE
jgi:hypothetical protein